jgi:site-specific DNA-methyltransferase (cytosine-N4-specific)
MRQMIAEGVRAQCVVTSPPYWGLRDYGVAGQFGLERTWVRHVARMRYVLRLVRELLTDDGVLWLNYGDSYHSPRAPGEVGGHSTINGQRTQEEFRRASRALKSRIRPPDVDGPNRRRQGMLKAKDLVGMPWRVALALQADGWWLRSEVIWHKPNPMPESVSDRPTKAHEHLFLLSRSEVYRYDAAAISEPTTGGAHPRQKPVSGHVHGPGSHGAKDHARSKAGLRDSTKFGRGAGWRVPGSFGSVVTETQDSRNARTVWTIPTQAYSGAHFATFPEELVARCVLAGSRPGDTILDPFMGSGTVGQVATDLGRNFIGCELNPEYVALHDSRRTTTGMAI